jgi:inner membrane protein
MLLWDRLVRRRRHPDKPPARLGPLVALAYLSVLSHPVLDWLNTYGVRLLMPFDGSWFYGDALFIIDPWLWLLMAAAAALAYSRSRRGLAGWLVLGLATSALVLGSGLAPPAAQVAWGLGLAAIVGLRLLRGAPAPFVQRVAAACGVALLAYVGAMLAGSRLAQRQAAEWLRAQGLPVEAVFSGPLPARPFARDVIALTPERYLFVEVDWLGDPRFHFSHPPLPREQPGPIVQAALEAPSLRGFRNWMRFPTWRVEETQHGWRVSFQDVRYSREDEGGFGTATLLLDRQLRPLGVEP